MISRAADIAVYSPDGQLRLVAEARARSGTTPDWAARLRKNLASHHFLPSGAWFLIAAPDRIYAWRNPAELELSSPDFTTPTREAFGDLWTHDLAGLTEESFVLLLRSWLETLVQADPKRSEAVVPSWIRETGLIDEIRQGRVVLQAAWDAGSR